MPAARAPRHPALRDSQIGHVNGDDEQSDDHLGIAQPIGAAKAMLPDEAADDSDRQRIRPR